MFSSVDHDSDNRESTVKQWFQIIITAMFLMQITNAKSEDPEYLLKLLDAFNTNCFKI